MERRTKWDEDTSEFYTFCDQELETVIHLLTQCTVTKSIWVALRKWLSRKCSNPIYLTDDQIILGT